MYIQGTLLNVRNVSTADFLEQVAEHAAESCHYFIVDPPPGITMSAAVDWRLIITGNGAVSAVAAGLWSGYEAFVLPLLAGQPNAAIFIQCKNGKGQFDQFTIGATLTDKKGVTQRLEDACRLLSPKITIESVNAILKETENSGFWERWP